MTDFGKSRRSEACDQPAKLTETLATITEARSRQLRQSESPVPVAAQDVIV
jgi:hypothetical protein